MEEVHVGEMTSTVRATDSRGLLDPGVKEEVVRAVAARVREERDYERRVAEETDLASSLAPDESIGGGT